MADPLEPPLRDQLLARVRARIQLSYDGVPAAALADEAVADVVALLRSVPDPASDVDVSYAAGHLYWCRYNGDRQPSDFAAAAELFKPIYRLGPGYCPPELIAYFAKRAVQVETPNAKQQRANSLITLAAQESDPVIANEAVSLMRSVLAELPPDAANRYLFLQTYAAASWTLFRLSDDPAHLDEAIESGEQAARAGGTGICLANLARASRARFALYQRRSDLDRAITAGEAASVHTFEEATDVTTTLSCLADAYQARITLTADGGDIDRGLAVSRRAVQRTPIGSAEFANRLETLGRIQLAVHLKGANIADLDAAIETRAHVVSSTRQDSSRLPNRLNDLGYATMLRFRRLGEAEDLQRATELLEQALALFPAQNHSDRHTCAGNLAGALLSDLTDLAKLNRVIVVVTDVLETAVDDARRAKHLYNLALAYRSRFLLTGSRPDHDRSLRVSADAVRCSPADAERPTLLAGLLVNVVDAYQASRSGALLRQAIDIGNEAEQVAPAGHPQRVLVITNLASALASSFSRTANLPDLDRAIRLLSEVVQTTPREHAHRDRRIAKLRHLLKGRADHTGELTDVDALMVEVLRFQPGTDTQLDGGRSSVDTASIDPRTERASAAPPRTARGDIADFLASIRDMVSRAKRSGGLPDIDAALAMCRTATTLVTEDDPAYVEICTNTTALHLIRHDQTGTADDIHRSIEIGERCLAATRHRRSPRSDLLANVANAYLKLFRRTRRTADLDRAAEIGDLALTSMDASESAIETTLLESQVNILRERLQHSVRLADLDRTITLVERLLNGRPAAESPRIDHALLLADLLQRHYLHSDDSQRLAEAIRILDDVVRNPALTPTERVRALTYLGVNLHHEHERTRDPAPLSRSIAILELAVEQTPVSDTAQEAIRLNALASVFRDRWLQDRRTGEYLDRSIQALSRAIDIATDSVLRRQFLGNLGVALRERHEVSGDPEDLDDAVRRGRRSLPGSTETEVRQRHDFRHFVNLALALHNRFVLGGDRSDLEQAVQMVKEGIQTTTVAPSLVAGAARSWGEWLADAGDWTGAAEGYACAVAALSLVPARGLQRGNQESLLSQHRSLAADAVAACVSAGDVGRAIEVWEQGRAVLLRQASELRPDLAELARDHPLVAQRFEEAVWRLENLEAVGDHDAEAGYGRSRDRWSAAEVLDAALSDIRAIPGYDQFPRSPVAADLRAAGTGGPVILVNVSDLRSDAIVVWSANETRVVRLAMVSPATVLEQVVKMFAALLVAQDDSRDEAVRMRAEEELTGVLGWLWDAIAKPVLDTLAESATIVQRLWWCPSGMLSFLPLHAAGNHATRFSDAPATVMDRVVSSYTPTIDALLRSGGAGRDLIREDAVLVVAMPSTPHHSDLRGTATEINYVKARFGSGVTVLSGRAATNDAVRAALPAARWVHFGCHGVTNLRKPALSYLALHDHERRPLTVADLARMRLDGADTAYLSACSTAQPSARLPDEAIHIAASCQLAGYRSVIASLWPASDLAAARIAKHVYARISPRADNAALVLTEATRRLRSGLSHRPSIWAGHVHYGA